MKTRKNMPSIGRNLDYFGELPKADCGPWVFNPAANILEYPPSHYYVDLDEVKNDADMLDWILHVMMKDWGNEAVAGLVWGLAAHLHPERVYRRLR